jgi:hypothetical protein
MLDVRPNEQEVHLMSQATSSQATQRRLIGDIGALRIAIIVLVVITALVHLQRGIGMSFGGPPGGGQGRPPAGAQGAPPGGGQGGFNIMQALPIPLPFLFLLNGIGYLVLVTALYLPQLHRFQPIVRWLLIAFAAVTMIMYFAIAGFHFNPIGYFTKAVEVTLIAVLLIEGRQSVPSMTDTVPG